MQIQSVTSEIKFSLWLPVGGTPQNLFGTPNSRMKISPENLVHVCLFNSSHNWIWVQVLHNCPSQVCSCSSNAEYIWEAQRQAFVCWKLDLGKFCERFLTLSTSVSLSRRKFSFIIHISCLVMWIIKQTIICHNSLLFYLKWMKNEILPSCLQGNYRSAVKGNSAMCHMVCLGLKGWIHVYKGI